MQQNQKEYQLVLPLRMFTSKKKIESINLNLYRNLHYAKLNHQKKAFHEHVRGEVSKVPHLGKVSLHYDLFFKRRGRVDLMNVGSVLDKYFSDVLTECNVVEDDDYSNIPDVSFSFGGLDTAAPEAYAIVTIKPIN